MWSLVPFMAAALVMVAALGALAYGFQQAGVEIPMLLAVMGALVVVTYSIKTLLEVAKQVNAEDIYKAIGILVVAAVLLGVVAYMLPDVLKDFLIGMEGIGVGAVLKAMLVTTVTIGSMMLLVFAALQLGKIAQGGGPAGIGYAALIILAGIALFWALTKVGFGYVLKEFAQQLTGFDGPTFAIQMISLTIGLAALAVGMLALIAFSVVAAVAWGAMSLLYGSGAINKPCLLYTSPSPRDRQ